MGNRKSSVQPLNQIGEVLMRPNSKINEGLEDNCSTEIAPAAGKFQQSDPNVYRPTKKMRSNTNDHNKLGATDLNESYEQALDKALSQLRKVEINKGRDYKQSNTIMDLKTRLNNGRNSEAKHQGLAAIQSNST